jgi:hypothetical protein
MVTPAEQFHIAVGLAAAASRFPVQDGTGSRTGRQESLKLVDSRYPLVMTNIAMV